MACCSPGPRPPSAHRPEPRGAGERHSGSWLFTQPALNLAAPSPPQGEQEPFLPGWVGRANDFTLSTF